MRVVALPADHVDVHLVPHVDADRVVDEAADDLLVEHLARDAIAHVLAGPEAVAFVRVVDALAEVGNPADAALAERELRGSGTSSATLDHTRSAAACTMLIGESVISTSIGASSAVITIFDDDPMCMFTTMPSSSHVAKNWSQWPEWMLG